MRLNEVTKLTEQELTEVIDVNNDTGFKTEDLVKIAMVTEDQWSEPMTAEQLIAEMESWEK